MLNITASTVLFNSNSQDVEFIINKLDECVTVFLIDNSPNNTLQTIATGSNIKYIHKPTNLGFGSAHNIAIKAAISIQSKYHFIINPDVFFEREVIKKMVNEMETNSSIGMMMPKILNLDGTMQHLPKLLPSPFSVLWRKIKIPIKQYSKFVSNYELRFVPHNIAYNAPILSGCFTMLNLKAIEEVGIYDENFFMYFEDWDLSRRMHAKYKTIYYPKVSVYHGYESGANKSFRLLKIFVKSAITYFNKWGWFFDNEREKINKRALNQFQEYNF